MTNYEVEDDGTMPANVEALAAAVVGHRIVGVDRNVKASPGRWRAADLVLTLDNGKRVVLFGTNDCCAYTELENLVVNLPLMDHAIMAVTAEDGYNTWRILADAGEVMALSVFWSAGNPFYYSYGFDIQVIDA